MKLSELPQEIQQRLIDERATLHEKWNVNTSYDYCVVNTDGTRFFRAHRRNDFGSFNANKWSTCGWWEISYGAIRWKRHHIYACGTYWGEEYRWEEAETFGKAVNGTVIPKQVHTKKEVIALAKEIGIFNI